MTIPCPTKIDCECSENPFGNLSSEDPDMLRYLGENYGWPYYFPNLGSNWSRNTCLGTCNSTISQAEADMCAALAAAICQLDFSGVCEGNDCPPGGGGDNGSGGVLPIVYYNNLASCAINCPDGNEFRYQVRAGLFASSTQALADRMAASQACNLARTQAICLGDLTNTACKDAPYISVLVATAPTPVTFSVLSGTLPPGMAFVPYTDKSTRLAGEPTTAGNYTFTVRATDANHNYMDKSFTIYVLGLDQTSIPTGYVDINYSTYITASGGIPGYTFTFAGTTSPTGHPPTGLTCEPDGNIHGFPEEGGTFNFLISITDSNGHNCTAPLTMRILGVCNTEVSDTINCPGFPGIITTQTVPADTYCTAPGTNPAIAQGQALADLQNRIATALAGKGCTCQFLVDYAAGTLTNTGSCVIQFTVRNYPSFTLIPAPNVFNLGAGVTIHFPTLYWSLTGNELIGFYSVTPNVAGVGQIFNWAGHI